MLESVKRREMMESATIVRIVAGVLFVVVLGILVARRKAKA